MGQKAQSKGHDTGNVRTTSQHYSHRHFIQGENVVLSVLCQAQGGL